MTETPTYYRPRDPEDTFGLIDQLVADGLLVPVVRCEHGNIDGHWMDTSIVNYSSTNWCPGAAVGEETP